ncbi:DMT family transporter [Terrilactibacillus sp. S3-3]|nr:DMT family transporter [Terrilactibacillus sp. S3-3]
MVVYWNHHQSLFSASPTFWLLTIYLAFFCTLLAFYIQLAMIRRTSPTRVGLLLGTEPLFAALFAVFVGGEHLTSQEWIGGLLIVASAYFGRHIETKGRMKENLEQEAG